MEQVAYESWLMGRDSSRAYLFGGADSPLPQETTLRAGPAEFRSLAELALSTSAQIRLSLVEQCQRQELFDSTAAILGHHEKMSHDKGRAIFGFVGVEASEKVIATTGLVLWRWELTSRRVGLEPPFVNLPVSDIKESDFLRPDVQAVVETAAAVAEVITCGYNVGSIGKRYHKKFAGFIAMKGPDYARRWLSGDVIRSYCEEHNHDTAAWLSVATPAVRIELAVNSPLSSLAKLERAMNALHNNLSTEALAEALPWSAEEIDAVLPAGFRKVIALRHNDPIGRVEEIMRLLDTDLSYPALAVSTGRSESWLRRELMPSLRVKAIMRRPSNPTSWIADVACSLTDVLSTENLAEHLGWSSRQVDKLFTPSSRQLIAVSSITDPLKRARAVVAMYETMTDEALAARLGISYTLARALFPASTRFSMAVASNRPFARAKEIKAGYTAIAGKHGFTDELTYFIAREYASKAANVALQIEREQVGRPPGVSADLWATVVATYPNAERDGNRRLEKIASFLLYIRVRYPLSLDRVSQDRHSRHETIGDAASTVEELLFGNTDVNGYLQDLAQRAGVSHADFQFLIEHFAKQSDNDIPAVESGNVAVLLAQLRLVNLNAPATSV